MPALPRLLRVVSFSAFARTGSLSEMLADCSVCKIRVQSRVISCVTRTDHTTNRVSVRFLIPERLPGERAKEEEEGRAHFPHQHDILSLQQDTTCTGSSAADCEGQWLRWASRTRAHPAAFPSSSSVTLPSHPPVPCSCTRQTPATHRIAPTKGFSGARRVAVCTWARAEGWSSDSR